MIVIALLLVVVQSCPASVADEAELISQPIECFRQLYDHRKYDNQKMLRTVTDRLQTYQRMLQELKMSAQDHLETTPVLKWAQSNAQIFISFKLSHRQDSPTCSDIRREFFKTEEVAYANGDIQFQIVNNGSLETSFFRYEGECYFTTQKFWFRLNLKFQKKLTKIVLRKQGLGLYTLIGDKEFPEIWGQPFNDFKKCAIWTQMRNKYENDMNNFFQKMSGEGEETVTRRRRRKRPKKEGEGEL